MQALLITNCNSLLISWQQWRVWGGEGSAVFRMHRAADTWQRSELHSRRLWFLPKFHFVLHTTIATWESCTVTWRFTVLNAMDASVHSGVRSLNWRTQRCLSRAVPLGHTPGSVQALHTVSGHFTGLWEFPQVRCKIASPSMRQFP